MIIIQCFQSPKPPLILNYEFQYFKGNQRGTRSDDSQVDVQSKAFFFGVWT